MNTTSILSSRERLETVFSGGTPDRTPILGGWIANPDLILAVTGASSSEYWSEPEAVSIKAYQMLGMDGLIDIFVPKSADDLRFVDANSYNRSETGLSLEEVLEKIDAMPSPEAIEDGFNLDRKYESFKQELIGWGNMCGEMVWMPAQWDAGAHASWYSEFGYETYFLLIGLYPDRAQKLMEVGGANGRCWSKMIARAVREGLYPHAVLMGEDLCTQRGPMISPEFLERYYAPQLRYGLQPLLDAGCRPVWHCDGDVRFILEMLMDCGIQGLQGFQPECGMELESLVRMRTRDGRPLLIFGPMAVTTELPMLNPEQIRDRVRHAIDTCRGSANLVLFTSNTINPDVSLENVVAMYEAVRY